MIILISFSLGIVFTLGAILAIRRFASFSAQSSIDYSDGRPRIDPARHLSGPMACDGVIYGPTGRVAARFNAKMEGVWNGRVGVLKEAFRYDSGTTQDREWRLTLDGEGRVIAEADDLVGKGIGDLGGPGLVLRYRLRLPQASGGYVLNVTDWMYLTESGALVNRSQFRKFGLKVAELVAVMRPTSPIETQSNEELLCDTSFPVAATG